MTRAVEKRLLAVVVILTIAAAFYDFGSVSAQGQKADYLWEGWHKVPDPSHIQYKVSHDRVVALSNLSKGSEGCSSFTFAGKIAKVNFDDYGTNVRSFALEYDDGDRSLTNVDRISLDNPGMTMVDLEWITQGLRTLIRPNWYIQGTLISCGAAGRFTWLDAIQSSSPTRPITPNASASAPTSTSEGQPQSKPVANNAEGVPLLVQGGTFVIPVQINGQITLNFTIDSGAADVSIPADVVSTLIRTGTIQKSDFIGQKTYRLADGSTVPSATFVIRSLKVGNHLLENVTGSIASAEADLLLGQSFLRRFNSWSIDNKRQVLLLN